MQRLVISYGYDLIGVKKDNALSRTDRYDEDSCVCPRRVLIGKYIQLCKSKPELCKRGQNGLNSHITGFPHFYFNMSFF